MNHPTEPKRTRYQAVLVLLWLAFLTRGAWYAAVAPAWEGFDEPFHFAYLQHVAAGLGPPARNVAVSQEVQDSLHLLPVPWELQFQRIPPPLTTDEAYWRLPQDERARREAVARSLAASTQYRPGSEQVLNYEAQQAPLYYWCFAAPLRAMAGAPLLSQIFALRMLNVLLASAVIPLCYLLARQVLGPAQAVGAAALLVLLPELMINLARVSNECMAILCYSVVLISAVKAVAESLHWRWWLLLGAALGCGLLTKAYFLTAVPAVVLIVAYVLLRGESSGRERLTILLRALAGGALTFAIAGRLYLGIHARTGSWSGQGDDVALRGMSFGAKLAAVPHVNWKSGVVSVLLSHIWFGGWSFLRLPLVWYVMGFAFVAAGVAGFIVRLARCRYTENQRQSIFVLGAFYLCFWGGLGYHVLITYLNQGVSASEGWYLYSLVTAEVVLLIWALQAFFSARLVVTGVVTAAAIADLYGVHALLLPYYTGLAQHQSGRVATALGQTMAHLRLALSRTAANRPDWLSHDFVMAMWVAYLAATAGTVVVTLLRYRPQDYVTPDDRKHAS